ncbi:tubulin alpha chain-like [Ceratina calcarata]|uniref:Tubulin alpha chain-like n=1 Tax=Ceratina calcarata TaxID=156304 RepID=A0AAJ7JC62_9HYME|nr:tubulin alpha chain-like [Ceratina calcarata]
MDSKPGEIIPIFVGQAGTQIANACWELFCLEHGISSSGCLSQGYYPPDINMCSVFAETQVRKMTPRTIIVDLEPTVVDEIRTGAYKRLFSPDCLITGKEDASNNYARGYHTLGQELIQLVLQRVCKLCESCSRPSGFVVFRSISGGTGGGFATLLLEHLAYNYPKTITLDFVLFPSPNISTVIVEPYNAVFATHGSLDSVNCCFLFDNEALYNICDRCLDVDNPTYTNLNRMKAQVVSSITASMRFEGALNLNLNELQTNLVPYPRVHFALAAYAPLISPRRAMHAEITTENITCECFEPSNQMVSCDQSTGAYTSCCLLYRGDVSPNDVNQAIAAMKGRKSIRFVTWSPTGFKVGINYQPTTTVPGGDLAPSRRTVVMASNNTAIKKNWLSLARKFDLMLQQRAFVHHYVGEGMEEGYFDEARESMSLMVDAYREIER